jgi:hypothetical protein
MATVREESEASWLLLVVAFITPSERREIGVLIMAK